MSVKKAGDITVKNDMGVGGTSILVNGFPGLLISLHLKTDIQAYRSCTGAIPEARLRSNYFKTNNNLNLNSLCHFS